MINWEDNKLTKEIKSTLKQGTKIKFMWYGNSTLEYIGRIETDKFGQLYFVNEHNYKDDILVYEGMRYYNPLESFFHFTMFELLDQLHSIK